MFILGFTVYCILYKIFLLYIKKNWHKKICYNMNYLIYKIIIIYKFYFFFYFFIKDAVILLIVNICLIYVYT
jgi:hypothetical protein